MNNNNKMTNTINLVSVDGPEFNVTGDTIKLSIFWSEMYEIEIGNKIHAGINSTYLPVIVDFCEKYTAKPFTTKMPLLDTDLTKCGVNEWANDFITKMDIQQVYQILMCGNFLDIEPLLKLCCAYFASLSLKKTPDEIKSVFKTIVTDIPYLTN
jgi:hypothetical protein